MTTPTRTDAPGDETPFLTRLGRYLPSATPPTQKDETPSGWASLLKGPLDPKPTPPPSTDEGEESE